MAYPVQVRARLDGRLSRWLWLVKWLLLVPHAVVLVVLWAGFWLMSLFALGTDRYPPFRLDVGGDEPQSPTDPDPAVAAGPGERPKPA